MVEERAVCELRDQRQIGRFVRRREGVKNGRKTKLRVPEQGER